MWVVVGAVTGPWLRVGGHLAGSTVPGPEPEHTVCLGYEPCASLLLLLFLTFQQLPTQIRASIQPRPSTNMATTPRPTPGPPTGVRLVIVGAGIGGLACAIESRQVGHEVVLLEAVKQFRRLGDSIGALTAGGAKCAVA